MPRSAEEKRAYMLEYNKRPDVIARQAERKSTAEYKAKHAEQERNKRAAEPKRTKIARERLRWQQRKADPEYIAKARAYQKEWMRERRRSDPEFRAKSIAASTAYLKAHPEKVADYKRKYNYSLAPGEFAKLFAAQGSCCAVCKSVVPHSKKGWQTDHCHDTGKVRGILCADCNRVVHNRTSADLLLVAAEYLKKALPDPA